MFGQVPVTLHSLELLSHCFAARELVALMALLFVKLLARFVVMPIATSHRCCVSFKSQLIQIVRHSP